MFCSFENRIESCFFFHHFLHTDLSDYTMPADIRMNNGGRQNLFHNGFKHYQPNKMQHLKQRWVCTSNGGRKCKGSIGTVEIDGKVMMKILNGEHTHQPVE